MFGGQAPHSLRGYFQAVQYRFRYHPVGKDRAHMNPLEPVIKTLCLQMGGRGAPPQTPRFPFNRAGL